MSDRFILSRIVASCFNKFMRCCLMQVISISNKSGHIVLCTLLKMTLVRGCILTKNKQIDRCGHSLGI